MAVVLHRRYRFSASHVYRRPEWSEEENLRRFGRCAWKPGHGHNYRLTVSVSGEPDPETGFIGDLAGLDRWVGTRVLDLVDHRHLNEALAEFASGARIPTSENLVLWIRDRLAEGAPPGCRLVGLRLEEDDDLAASWQQ
jgi:6-pyruvoyltetrahydropterin/6-carboxytetrahydropterin synthase